MPSKVSFQVVYSSSADDNHREKELEVQWLITVCYSLPYDL